MEPLRYCIFHLYCILFLTRHHILSFEDLSTVFTLEAGDIIATGTPAGVGAGRDPQEWMYDGDVVEATVEGIDTSTINGVKPVPDTLAWENDDPVHDVPVGV